MFIEVSLRKIKCFAFWHLSLNTPVLLFGLSDTEYFEQIGLALDVYSNYEKFLLTGDFNMEEEEDTLKEFLFEYNAKSLVKEKTCYKSFDNPSCIDLFLTNSQQSFQNTIATCLLDFHKMVITVMNTSFPKAKPKVMQYKDHKNLALDAFRNELKIGHTTRSLIIMQNLRIYF